MDKNTAIKEHKKNSKCEIQSVKKRKSYQGPPKNRYYHELKAPAERMQSTFSNAITRKHK